MGFLDRIWDSLFGRSEDHNSTSFAPPDRNDRGAVAVLDAPPDVHAEGTGPASEIASSTADEGEKWWMPSGETTTEPRWMEPIELVGEARAFESHLVSYFDGHDLNMPPMPHVAESVLKKLRDPNFGMIEVAKVLSDDQVTAADVLRLVNSPLYRGAYKITTLQGAVTRLGTQALRTLMLHQSLRAVTFPKIPEAQGLAQMLWSRSLASGCVMRHIAPLAGLDAEDAFMLGLLHDIGNVIVLRLVCDQELISHHWLDEETFEYLCYETHQEFGELVAEKWLLPDAIKAVVASHHAAPVEDDAHAKERWLTLFSDMICQALGFGPSRSYDLLASEPARRLGLDKHADIERMLSELPGRVSETIAHLA